MGIGFVLGEIEPPQGVQKTVFWVVPLYSFLEICIFSWFSVGSISRTKENYIKETATVEQLSKAISQQLNIRSPMIHHSLESSNVILSKS